MLTCTFAVDCWVGLEELSYRKIGSRTLNGVILKFDLTQIPPTIDVTSFAGSEEEIDKHTTGEVFQAYKRALTSGDTIVI